MGTPWAASEASLVKLPEQAAQGPQDVRAYEVPPVPVLGQDLYATRRHVEEFGATDGCPACAQLALGRSAEGGTQLSVQGPRGSGRVCQARRPRAARATCVAAHRREENIYDGAFGGSAGGRGGGNHPDGRVTNPPSKRLDRPPGLEPTQQGGKF